MNTAKNLLFIDDDSIILEALCVFFEDEGFWVKTAQRAEQGLSYISAEPEQFDLCMVDMRLPGIDGNQFILMAHDLQPALKFLIYTGSTNYELPEELSAIGLKDDDVMLKPIADMDIILKKVQQKIC